MNYVLSGFTVLGLLTVLLIVYCVLAYTRRCSGQHTVFFVFGLIVFFMLFFIVVMIHNRMGLTEAIYLEHRKLKEECELAIPRQDNCILVIKYIPEHRG